MFSIFVIFAEICAESHCILGVFGFSSALRVWLVGLCVFVVCCLVLFRCGFGWF